MTLREPTDHPMVRDLNEAAGSPRPRAPRWLFGCAAVGFIGMVLIVLGAAQPDSPFTSKLPGSWLFGIPGHEEATGGGGWLGLLLVSVGIVLVLAGWYWLVTLLSGSGLSVKSLAVVFAAWVAPLMAAPPLFSRDVYAYAAQGQLAARGFSPYRQPVATLGNSPFLHLVDPLWRTVHTSYGPFFIDLAKADVIVMGHNLLGSVEILRLLCLLGVVLVAVSVPSLARSYGYDPSVAFALAVLNPLVLLQLIGGAHNDAIMIGLLVAGIAVARAHRPVVGIVLCSLGAMVKIPGLIGVIYIAWMWAGTGATRLRRLNLLVESCLIAVAVMAAVSVVSGYGWGWTTNVNEPGHVVSWLDPATALGLVLAHISQSVGAGQHAHELVNGARLVALVAAGVFSVVMLLRSERLTVPRALGWSLLVIVFLGPIVWPWYETWGLVFLAVIAQGWTRRAVFVLSGAACFATVPSHLSVSPRQWLLMAFVLAALVAVLVGVSVRLGQSTAGRRADVQAAARRGLM